MKKGEWDFKAVITSGHYAGLLITDLDWKKMEAPTGEAFITESNGKQIPPKQIINLDKPPFSTSRWTIEPKPCSRRFRWKRLKNHR